MLKANKLYVIGIGYRPLEKRAREILAGAEVILASSRLSDVFRRYDEFEAVKDRIKVINRVPETIEFIKEHFSHSAIRNPQSAFEPVVLLASGDPLFFGIGRRMLEEFGGDAVEMLPDLSSIQSAFARIKEPWDDAFFISLHGGPDIAKRRKLPYEVGDIPRLIERYGKLGVLTDRENTPVLIANVLQSGIRNPQSAIVIHVCERLGYPDEKITRGTAEEIAGMSFSDPNVVIIRKTEDRSQESGVGSQNEVRFGLREDEIAHERGLITKDEVRAATIHKLRLPGKGVFWDIGAGAGSVSLEAARLCPGLRVIAVEKEQERIDTMKRNMQRYTVRNMEIIHGTAPEALTDLPAPDRVFIGGSGGNLNEIISYVSSKMSSGIMVINAVILDTLNGAISSLEKNGFPSEVSEISVSRSKVVAGKMHLSALNPVFIVKGERG